MATISSKVKLGNLTISGSVLSVLNGVVDEADMHAVGPHHFRFALGSGTFSSLENIGETLIVNGRPHVSWLQGKKVHTEVNSKVSTPFLIGLDEKQQGGTLLRYKPSPSPVLQMFYQDLLLDYPTGVAIVGHVIFDELHSTYLTKPPIFGENINEHVDDYWAKKRTDKSQSVTLFGVVLPEEGAKKYPKEILERAFYQNPHESHPASLYSHTHGGLNETGELGAHDKIEAFFDSLGKTPIKGVRHILTSSLIREGTFVLFPV